MVKQSKKQPFKVKCWPILSNGEHSNQTYEVTVTDIKDIIDYPKRIWKIEIIK